MKNNIVSTKSQEIIELIPQFTIVNHQARKKLKLTFTEYCIVDSMSNQPRYEGGWSYAPNQYLANWLGISKRYLLNVYKKLYKNGLIKYPEKKVKNDTRVRVTQKFYDADTKWISKKNIKESKYDYVQ